MSTKNLQKKVFPADFAFDLLGLKHIAGVMPVSTAGCFVGLSAPATFKQVERITFPITVSAKGQDGLCCLKVNVEKYLRDGVPQPQDFLLGRKNNSAPPRKKIAGRKTNREKDAEKRLKALVRGGVSC